MSDHAFLRIKKSGQVEISWDEWTSALAARRQVTMAWIYDEDYESWQNTDDPAMYEAAGRPYSHLPMKQSDLPPPLDRLEIDTAKNPGRYVIRDGYIEAVGSTMWLGERFWSLTGSDEVSTAKVDWLNASRFSSGLLRIEAAKECFTTADGLSGQLQIQLLTLLFPNSAD